MDTVQFILTGHVWVCTFYIGVQMYKLLSSRASCALSLKHVNFPIVEVRHTNASASASHRKVLLITDAEAKDCTKENKKDQQLPTFSQSFSVNLLRSLLLCWDLRFLSMEAIIEQTCSKKTKYRKEDKVKWLYYLNIVPNYPRWKANEWNTDEWQNTSIFAVHWLERKSIHQNVHQGDQK